MDRFTIKQSDGTYHVYGLGIIQEISCCDENNKNWFSLYEGAAIDKLGQYEDVGLTPQEIAQMKTANIGFEKFEEDFYANPDTMFIKSNKPTVDKELNKCALEEKVLKAVKACSEFCCGECPYQHLDDPDGYLKMRCIHALMVDINKMLNGEEV